MREARVLIPRSFDKEIGDTLDAIEEHDGVGPLYDYIQGWRQSHFPMPAIRQHASKGLF